MKWVSLHIFVHVALICVLRICRSLPLFIHAVPTGCGEDSVNIIDLRCRGLVISDSTLQLSISIHLQRHPTNGEGIQFASIHSKLFCSVVLLTSTIKQSQCGGTHRRAAGWQWMLPSLQHNRSIQRHRGGSASDRGLEVYVLLRQLLSGVLLFRRRGLKTISSHKTVALTNAATSTFYH